MLFGFSLSLFVGHWGYKMPNSFVPLVDITATVLSVLVAVSLAVFAILASKPDVRNTSFGSNEERARAIRVVNEDDKYLAKQQFLVFLTYYIALGTCLVFKFAAANGEVDVSILTRTLAAAFAGFGTMAFVFSILLPSLLKKLIEQRSNL